jgi:hypothetical protein
MNEAAQRCYRKYEQFSNIARIFEESEFGDEGWGIVVRFYAALQLMNAYLIQKQNVNLDVDSTVHEFRKHAMKMCPELREAPAKYRVLKELSEHVRYNPEFNFEAKHRDESILLFTKIVAIVDPKIKKT